MEISRGLLLDEEVYGVRSSLEGHNPPIPWRFKDDEGGIRFILQVDPEDPVSMKYDRLIMTIFDRFCERRGITPKEILMRRITLLVQDNLHFPRLPMVDHMEPHKCFIYFATTSDSPTIIGDEQVVPTSGLAVSFDGGTPYTHSTPDKENFLMVVEVTYTE